MAFSLRSLQRLVNPLVPGLATGALKSGAPVNLWRYATDDAAATVEGTGYWNGARDAEKLVVGDVVIATMNLAGTPVVKTYVFTVVPSTGNVVAVLQTTTAG